VIVRDITELYREESTEFESKDSESTSKSFTLIISDTGVGVPESLDIENLDSPGIQLVTSLVDQLEGELELKRNNGKEFIIRFAVTGKK
jgi:two-component sensor histidine kinase